MKHNLRFIACLALVFSIFVTSCKKDDSDTVNPDPQTNTDEQIAAHADDESRVSNEMNTISAEASVLVESSPVMTGNNSTLENMICDAEVSVNLISDPVTVSIVYNGTNCGSERTRTGKVILSAAKGAKWRDAGATINVKYENLKITRTADQKSFTLNGNIVWKNVSGGLLLELASIEDVLHTITSENFTVKFDDGEARPWNIARANHYTFSNGVVVAVDGLKSEGEINNIAEWGTNRFGNAFKTTIDSSVVIRQSCDFHVTAGTVTHITSEYTASIRFGLNAQGNAVLCGETDHFYCRLTATKKDGQSLNLLLPY